MALGLTQMTRHPNSLPGPSPDVLNPTHVDAVMSVLQLNLGMAGMQARWSPCPVLATSPCASSARATHHSHESDQAELHEALTALVTSLVVQLQQTHSGRRVIALDHLGKLEPEWTTSVFRTLRSLSPGASVSRAWGGQITHHPEHAVSRRAHVLWRRNGMGASKLTSPRLARRTNIT